MKKIPALLLIFVLLLQACFFNVSAQDKEIVTVTGLDYTSGSPSETDKAGNQAQIRTGSLSYSVNLASPVASIKLEYSTGEDHQGIVEVIVNGNLVEKLDTKILAPTWATYTYVIVLPKPIVGENTVTIKCDTGAHWIKSLTFLPYDNSKRFAAFVTEDNFEDIQNDVNRHEINLLSDLDIVKKEGVDFNPEKFMSRIDFVSILGRLLEAEKYADETYPFKDVLKKDENADVLTGLYKLGIIKGGTDGKFRPHDFITTAEVASVCANALGYEAYSKDMNVSLNLAHSLKLFKGLSLKANTITRSEGVKIIYNLLLADFLAVSEMYENVISYNPAKNFLEKSSKYFHGTGVMTANNVTELYQRKNSEQIEIGGNKYYLETGVVADLLGINCEFFYIEKDGEKYICAIRPLPKSEVNVIKSDKNIRFDTISERKLEFTYIKEDEEFEYELDSATAIIYNATALDTNLVRLIPDAKEFSGVITTIDNDADGVLEAIWIDHVSRVINVETVVGKKIKDKFTQTFIDTSEGEFSYFISGRVAEIDEITQESIISLYESSDRGKKKITRAIKNVNVITGTIKAVADGVYTIGDEQYKLSSNCYDDIYLGLTGNFTLDEYDFIVACKESEDSELKIGAFLAYSNDNPTSLESHAGLKLLTKDGIVKYNVAKKVTADGVIIKSIDDFYNGNATFTGMVNVAEQSPVLYKLNAAGEISMIDTINDGTKDLNDQLISLLDVEDGNPINTIQTGSYRYYGNVFVDENWVAKYGVKSGATLLAFTTDNNENNYRILSGYSCEADALEEVAIFSTSRESMVANLILSRNYSMAANRAQRPFFFKRITAGINNEGDVVNYIQGVSNNGEVSYEIDADIYSSDSTFRTLLESLKEGNLVGVFLTDSRVVAAELVYVPANQPDTFGPAINAASVTTVVNSNVRTVESRSGSGVTVLGKIVNVEGSFVKINIQHQVEGVWTDREWTFNAGSAQVAICEKTPTGKYIMTGDQRLSSLVKGDIVVGVRGSQGILSAAYVFRDSSQ